MATPVCVRVCVCMRARARARTRAGPSLLECERATDYVGNMDGYTCKVDIEKGRNTRLKEMGSGKEGK